MVSSRKLFLVQNNMLHICVGRNDVLIHNHICCMHLER